MKNNQKTGLQDVMDWLAQKIDRLRHGESFAELNARYQKSLSDWEDGFVAKVLMQEWLAGNLVLNPNQRRESDKAVNKELGYDEIDQALERGIVLDDVFFSRGQYSFDTLWETKEPSPSEAAKEGERSPLPDHGIDH